MKQLIFLLLVTFTACNDSQVEQINQIGEISKNIVQEGVERAQQALPSKEDLSKMTPEQIDKVLSFEYKVIDLDVIPNAEKLETTLNTLGAERWECIAQPQGEVPLRIQCKRPAKILFRYLFQSMVF